MKPFSFAFLLCLPALTAPVFAQTPATVTAPVAPAPLTSEQFTEIIRQGDAAKVKAALEAQPKLIESKNGGQSPLYAAITGNKPEITRLLLEKGADPNAAIYGQTPLATAMTGYYQAWQANAELLLEKGANLEAIDNQGQTVLLSALQQGGPAQIERVTYLLGKDASLEARNQSGQNALISAFYNSAPAAIVKLLLDKTDVNRADENDRTPLLAAVAFGKTDYVRQVLDKGADVNAQNAYGDTALHLAAKNPQGLLKMLLDAGAKTTIRNKNGDLPLHIALRPREGLHASTGENANAQNAVPYGTLIAPLTAKSDINAKDQFGISPLLLALEARDQESRDAIVARAPRMDATTQLFDATAQGDLDTLRKLLAQKPFLTYFRLPDGTTPLHVAALWGTLGAAQLLVQKGADINARDSRGTTPLHQTLLAPRGLFARRARNMEAFLLQKNADFNALDASGNSPLSRAVEAGDNALIAPLLAKNADVNSRDREGQSPIFALMTKTSDLATVKTLIERGAKLNFRPNIGGSLLSRAAQTHRVELVRLLLENGADASARDAGNSTPLATLINSSYGSGEDLGEIIKLLLDKGADPNFRIYGESLLQSAISRDSISSLRALLASKKISLKASDGRESPLAQAVNYNRVEMVKLLLAAGADPGETTYQNKTLAQVAAERSKEMAEAFKTKPAP